MTTRENRVRRREHTIRKLGSALLMLSTVAGCAGTLNQHNVMVHNNAGGQAEAQGNWQLAERNYELALYDANLGFGSDTNKSMVMYNLGRTKGHLCKFEEAEMLLTESLKLEETVTGPDSGITSMRLFELGRMHLDRQQYAQAVPYFARAIPAVTKLGVEQRDPIAMAAVYDDYAAALRLSGDLAASDLARGKADQLRSANPGQSPRFIPVRYDQVCPAR